MLAIISKFDQKNVLNCSVNFRKFGIACRMEKSFTKAKSDKTVSLGTGSKAQFNSLIDNVGQSASKLWNVLAPHYTTNK